MSDRAGLLLYWRTRERESGQPPPDVYGSPASYPYGKVDSDLRVITETGESPYVCCGYCAAHMACWTAREGITTSMFNEAHDMRDSGGRPHNAGSNPSELRKGAHDALGITLDALAVDEIVGRLADGYATAVSLQYADLPSYLKVQSNDFGHGATLYGYRASDECVGYFDPLWPSGSQGAWAKWADIRRALWSDGNHSTTLTKWGGTTVEDDMPINAYAGLTSNLRADVPAGLDWYTDANLSKRGGSFASAANVVCIGNPVGETVAGGSRAVLISTGNIYNDHQPRPTVVYVAAGAIDPVTVPPPSGSPDVAEAIAARDEDWREWLLDGSPGEATP